MNNVKAQATKATTLRNFGVPTVGSKGRGGILKPMIKAGQSASGWKKQYQTPAEVDACSEDEYPATKRSKKNSRKAKRASKRASKKPAVVHHQPSVPHGGYTFVVQRDDGEWLFCYFEYGTAVRVSSQVRQIFPSVTSDVREIWKRVVVDGAFDWECYVPDPRTLKLVEVQYSIKECSDLLFDDADEKETLHRRAVLSKLSDDEAKILNVDSDHALMKMFKGERDYNSDNRLVERLRDHGSNNPHGEFLRTLEK